MKPNDSEPSTNPRNQWIFRWSSLGIIVLIILIIALQDIILIEEDGGVEGFTDQGRP